MLHLGHLRLEGTVSAALEKTDTCQKPAHSATKTAWNSRLLISTDRRLQVQQQANTWTRGDRSGDRTPIRSKSGQSAKTPPPPPAWTVWEEFWKGQQLSFAAAVPAHVLRKWSSMSSDTLVNNGSGSFRRQLFHANVSSESGCACRLRNLDAAPLRPFPHVCINGLQGEEAPA